MAGRTVACSSTVQRNISQQTVLFCRKLRRRFLAPETQHSSVDQRDAVHGHFELGERRQVAKTDRHHRQFHNGSSLYHLQNSNEMTR